MTFSPQRFGLCMIFAAALGDTALAQSSDSQLAECMAIEDDRERLACYDRVTGRQPTARPDEEAPSTERAADGGRPATHLADYFPSLAREPTGASMIDSAWGFARRSEPYIFDVYHPNYFLVARYSSHVNNQPFTPVFQAAGATPQDLDNVEAKFQLSFKMRLWTSEDRQWGVWAAYTQQNQWQLYNGTISRPFRETNYMPELFVSYRVDGVEYKGFTWRLVNVGLNHQSNGRSDPLSRSWNRVFAEFGVERQDLVLFAKVWYRIKENADKDDNPDITNYYGYSQFNALYRLDKHSFTAMARGYIGTGGRGAYQLGWMSPPFLGPLRAYVQLFSGYGESMIDYNWKQTTIGAGVALNDGL
jgi:phospholipase A1